MFLSCVEKKNCVWTWHRFWVYFQTNPAVKSAVQSVSGALLYMSYDHVNIQSRNIYYQQMLTQPQRELV